MTLSMRHATWQQLSHEPRAAINAIVAIRQRRRMHLIAKIKTLTHTPKSVEQKTNIERAAQQNMKPQKPLKPKPKPAKAKAKSERHLQWGQDSMLPPPHKNSDPNACDTPVLEWARGRAKGDASARIHSSQ